jgi:hypothetical protein
LIRLGRIGAPRLKLPLPKLPSHKHLLTGRCGRRCAAAVSTEFQLQGQSTCISNYATTKPSGNQNKVKTGPQENRDDCDCLDGQLMGGSMGSLDVIGIGLLLLATSRSLVDRYPMATRSIP